MKKTAPPRDEIREEETGDKEQVSEGMEKQKERNTPLGGN